MYTCDQLYCFNLTITTYEIQLDYRNTVVKSESCTRKKILSSKIQSTKQVVHTSYFCLIFQQDSLHFQYISIITIHTWLKSDQLEDLFSRT